MAAKHPSFSEFAKGTVLSEADVEIIAAKCTWFDYRGKRDAVPAVQIDFKASNGEVYEQFYKVGEDADYKPTTDGKQFDLLTDREKIHERSKFGIFMEAFFKAGFPRNRVNNSDIGFMVGTRGHVHQEVVKYTGGGDIADSNVLVFDKVTGLPGEGRAATGSSGTADDSDEAVMATEILKGILKENDGSIERKSLLPKVIRDETYKGLEPKGLKTAVLNLIKTDEFIMGGTDWTVSDTGVIELVG